MGLDGYEQAFRENDIASAVLPELTDRDLKDLGVSLGHRRLLLKAIADLAARVAMLRWLRRPKLLREQNEPPELSDGSSR